MKLTAVILLSACLSASAEGYSQITLSEKNAPLQKIFKQIQQQSGYNFLCTYELLQQAGTISVEVKNVSLQQALEACLEGKGLRYVILDKTVVIKKAVGTLPESPPVFITVKGRIINEKDEPVIATITVKGTNNATSSNSKGEFSLSGVDENATLLITGVNIQTQEQKVGSKTEFLIRVKTKVTNSDPVTVTAYGIERKEKEIGYSVTKVTGEQINRANPGNLLTGLIGKVSGLGITTQSSDMTPQMRILLRGIRSFGENSNNQPLFIFNGAPLSFGNDRIAAAQVAEFINNFNPADIEDVTILKGANGTALYGPEGVNGVIIITTKKASRGAPVINFRNNTSVQIVDFRQDNRQRQFGLGSGQVDMFGNGIYDPRGFSNWGPAYDGSLVPIGYPDENGELQKVTYSDKKDTRRFWDAAITNRTNLSFSQADATSSYYLGVGYLTQTGLLPGDKQNQLNVLLNTSRKFGNHISVSTNINYSRLSSNRGRNLEGMIKSMPTFIPLLEYKDWKNGYWASRNRYWKNISPYEELANNRTNSTTNAINGSIIFELKPVDWLTIRDQPGINYSGMYSKSTSAPVNFADFARQDPDKMYDKYPATSELTTTNTSLNNDLLVSTIHKTGDFLIRTNIGNTVRQNYVKELQAGATLGVPVYNLQYRLIPVVATEAALLSRTVSAFGSASLGYKDRAFFEVTARNEWDSKRAKVARGKDIYASANTSLILTEIFPSLKNFRWLTTARLRASVAKSANMNISPYQSERILVLDGNYPVTNPLTGEYTLSYVFYPNVNPNPLLKPEKVLSQEYGLFLSLFNSRLEIDATYYYQVNNSVILNVASAWLSGYPTTDNAGRFQNQGWELDVNLNPVRLGKYVTFSAQLRGAINSNKVLSLTPVYNGLFPARDATGQQYYARPGHSAYEYGIRDWKRDPEGRVIVDKVTGYPTAPDYNDYTIKGTTLPKYTTSLGLNFTWKRFSTSILLDYIGGYDHLFSTDIGFYNGSDPRTTYNNRKPFVFPNSVYNDGTGKYVPNTDVAVKSAGQELYANYYYWVTQYGLINAAYWKLREMAIQYDLLIKSTWLKGLAFSVYGRDLLTLYPRENIYGDPGLVRGPGYREIQSVGSNLVGGANNGNNLTGGASDATVLPGTVHFGFTLSARF